MIAFMHGLRNTVGNELRYKCDQCGKYRPQIEYFVRRADDDEPIRVCSPSCLVELAWECKEAQSKLSKSKSV